MPNESPVSDYYTTQATHVKQCRKEAILVFAMWLLGLIVTCSIAGAMGYPDETHRPDTPTLVMGIPSWVFWAVIVPWIVQIGITWFFALKVIKDDEPFVEIPAS